MSGSKRRYKTLRRTPLATVVAQEIAAAKRPAESAARTDRHIKAGLHPLAAYAASRQGARTNRRKAS
jgi:hypothetical protein